MTPDAVRTLVEEGPSDVSRLMELGVEFDRDRDNRLDKTLEGGHSRRRVFHHRDQTGLAIMECLSGHVKACGNIDVMENTPVYSVTKIDNGFCIEFICGDKPYKVFTSALILATGGIGQVYRYTTNSAIATGDGIRFAYELGAETRNLSGIQFHPTAFAGSIEPRAISYIGVGQRRRGVSASTVKENGLWTCMTNALSLRRVISCRNL